MATACWRARLFLRVAPGPPDKARPIGRCGAAASPGHLHLRLVSYMPSECSLSWRRVAGMLPPAYSGHPLLPALAGRRGRLIVALALGTALQLCGCSAQ